MANKYIITIDQGTTGSRVFLINKKGKTITSAYEEFKQYFPKPSWVEHDAEEIWSSVSKLLKQVMEAGHADPKDAVAIGITNQRETTVIWDSRTGKPIYNAIVWQCRRTSQFCDSLKEKGLADKFKKKTGLVLDAYFSGTKIKWILDNVKGAREKAKKGQLLFGTIDSFLLYKLTDGKSHKTDYTNASRTLIYNIHEKKWDEELLNILDIPQAMLPEVQASASLFGETEGLPMLPDGVEIHSLIGDQQAALYGQFCHNPGDAKNTYGTGCFMLKNLGDKYLESKSGLLTTLACDANGQPVYALEGSVFIGGAVIQYLRDSLEFFQYSAESEKLADSVKDKDDDIVFVPAFAGLGAPYWDQDARGAIFGLTRDTNKAQITRAALKSIALQSLELSLAMENDSKIKLTSLKVDGGATQNDYLMKYQAAILGVSVIRPRNVETTMLGATYLAGISSGFWESPKDLLELNPPRKTFEPDFLSKELIKKEIKNWKDAVKRVLS